MLAGNSVSPFLSRLFHAVKRIVSFPPGSSGLFNTFSKALGERDQERRSSPVMSPSNIFFFGGGKETCSSSPIFFIWREREREELIVHYQALSQRTGPTGTTLFFLFFFFRYYLRLSLSLSFLLLLFLKSSDIKYRKRFRSTCVAAPSPPSSSPRFIRFNFLTLGGGGGRKGKEFFYPM